MKLSEALNADVRKEGVWEELHKMLCTIPPLKRYKNDERVPYDVLERLLKVFYDKYKIHMQYIMSSSQKLTNGDTILSYTASIKNEQDNSHIVSVYGLSIYECFVKVVLYSYGYVKRDEKK